MVLRVKNFNFWGGSLRNLTFRERGSRKTNIEGRLPRKGGGGAWTVCRYKRGGLGKKEGVVFFKGVLIPQCTLWLINWRLKKRLSTSRFHGSRGLEVINFAIFSMILFFHGFHLYFHSPFLLNHSLHPTYFLWLLFHKCY